MESEFDTNEVVEPEEAGEQDETKKPNRRDSVLEVSVVVLIALFLALLLKMYVAEAYMIRGQSMKPTFDDGERVMVQKCLYDIERGDIVIFGDAREPGKDLIKRVIGLPGDEVLVKSNGEVIVNGAPLEEDYIRRSSPSLEGVPVRIRPHMFYVLGDNRPHSMDSRRFGAIKDSSIKGKVFLRWWPLSEFRSF